MRILACYLPVKSPWLNPIEPKWVHSKRAIVEPTRLLSAQEVADRVGAPIIAALTSLTSRFLTLFRTRLADHALGVYWRASGMRHMPAMSAGV